MLQDAAVLFRHPTKSNILIHDSPFHINQKHSMDTQYNLFHFVMFGGFLFSSPCLPKFVFCKSYKSPLRFTDTISLCINDAGAHNGIHSQDHRRGGIRRSQDKKQKEHEGCGKHCAAPLSFMVASLENGNGSQGPIIQQGWVSKSFCLQI